MEKKFLSRIIISILIITLCSVSISCPDKYTHSWEDISQKRLECYDNNVTESNKKSGVYVYSLFDKNLTQDTVNNVSVKIIGDNGKPYDICGFEGTLQYISGPVYEFGFIFNVNKLNDENDYYMAAFTPNGTFSLYYYDGTNVPQYEGKQNLIKEFSPSESNYIKDGVNTIRVETTEDASIIYFTVYVNDKEIWKVENPEIKYGGIGFFEMLKYVEIAKFSKTNPLKTEYSIKKVQHY